MTSQQTATATCLQVDDNGRCNNPVPEKTLFCTEHYAQWENGNKDNFKTLIHKFISNNR